MYAINQRILGTAILVLLGTLVFIKQLSTGSILDKPKGRFLVQLVNIFNLFFLLIVNPLVAILLILGRLDALDPTRLAIDNTWVLMILIVAGIIYM